MNSGFEGPASVVVTSISPPNPVMQELASQSKTRGLSFFVIGDVPSPSDFSLDGCEFYSLERQKATGLAVAESMPVRRYSRKNIGYLLAMRNRSRLILETDDDNMPRGEFWDERKLRPSAKVVSGGGWRNVYAYFTEVDVWPRGFPLDAAREKPPQFEALPEAEVTCPIQQGLPDGDPDVDAIYRLLFPLSITFRIDRQIALKSGAWCPFNSQSTAWFPQAYPLLYLPSYCSFRMTDIWRSFVAQRIAWENDWSILFRGPDVFQDRNEHNLMRDFADEVPGYLHNRAIADGLAALTLKKGQEDLAGNLLICYEELVRSKWIDARELALIEAWTRDLAELG
jgi:hypothetical protein